MEDLENIARYKNTSKGLSYLNDKEYKDAKKRLDKKIKSITNNRFLSNDEKIKILKDLPKTDKSYAHDLNYINSIHNEIGLLPNILPGEEKEVKSITKSAIAPGEIEIGNALININRNIANSLNKLDEIFNKQELKERQETARLFSKYANEAIHNISEAMDWKDGSAEKVALHALVGKLSMDIAKGNEITGTAAGAISEVLFPHILKLTDNNPTKAQWIAYVLGYATDKALGGNGEQGGAVSQYGVKWNAYKDYYYKIGPLVIFKVNLIECAIKNAEKYNDFSTNERIKINLGHGDTIHINVGHGYYRTHKTQDKLGLPPLSYTKKEDVLNAVVACCLSVVISNTQETKTSKYYHTNLLVNGYDGKLHYVRLQISIYKEDENTYKISNFYPVSILK